MLRSGKCSAMPPRMASTNNQNTHDHSKLYFFSTYGGGYEGGSLFMQVEMVIDYLPRVHQVRPPIPLKSLAVYHGLSFYNCICKSLLLITRAIHSSYFVTLGNLMKLPIFEQVRVRR